jgi:hypothetical protein
MCSLFSIPQNCFSHEKVGIQSFQFFDKLFPQDSNTTVDKILESFNSLKNSENPFNDGMLFLDSLLRDLNSLYGLDLTIHMACQLIREMIDTLDIPKEMQSIVLSTIELYESNSFEHTTQKLLKPNSIVSTEIYWPFEWSILNLLKKKSEISYKKTKITKNSQTKLLLCEVNEPELPADIYIGGVELLAGALCMIVGTAIPPFYAVGTVLLGDGANRVFNGVSQIGDERRSGQSYADSNFGVRF